MRIGPPGSATEWTQHARDWKELQGRLENHIAHRIAQGYRRVAAKPAPSTNVKPIAKRRRVARPKGIVAAFATAEAWLTANGGAAIVKNLAKPTTDAALARAEKRLGFPIPETLKQLWKVHDGQKSEGDPFVHSRNLLSVAEAVRFRDDFVTSIRFIIDNEDDGVLKPAERNDRWLPFAAQDSDMYAVHAMTGRVFDFCETLDIELAKNVVAWFESYAQAIAQGEYTVTEGFGGVYLSS
jgi:cell wall assembly regulator SMI1